MAKDLTEELPHFEIRVQQRNAIAELMSHATSHQFSVDDQSFIKGCHTTVSNGNPLTPRQVRAINQFRYHLRLPPMPRDGETECEAALTELIHDLRIGMFPAKAEPAMWRSVRRLRRGTPLTKSESGRWAAYRSQWNKKQDKQP